MADFARPLDTLDLSYRFLVDVLELTEDKANEFCMAVMKTEIMQKKMALETTLTSSTYRVPKYKSDDARINLRRKIFDELSQGVRLVRDDDIKLGVGGAKPITVATVGKQAVLLLGLPASGKSSIGSQIADAMGAYIVDSDYAKRKFPEFAHEFGASLVHQESSVVTFGDKINHGGEFNLLDFCGASGYNIVIPKIGSDPDGVLRLRDRLISEFNYSVHLVLISLDRQEACRRALERFIKTNRYVSLSMIFDLYGNDPILTYYRVKDSVQWCSVAKLSTFELQSKGPLLMFEKNGSPVNTLGYSVFHK